MKYDDEAASQPKWQVGLGIPGYDRATTIVKLRYGVSAFVWLAWPPLTLLPFRSTRWEPSFRAQPYNNSYDAMFIAATAGIGATSLCALVLSERVNRAKANVFPAHLSWRNAFVMFEVFLSATLAILNIVAGANGSGLGWTAAFAVLLFTTFNFRDSQRNLPLATRPPRRVVELLASALLFAFAGLFIAFPVLQPWSGPPD